MQITEEKILTTFYGLWGDMRRDYLHRTQPTEWKRMLDEGTLEQYLNDYEDMMFEQEERMTAEICKRDGVTEELKKRDVMQWIRRYNSVLAEVRERLAAEIMPEVGETFE
mgnify:CR=1 FL=1